MIVLSNKKNSEMFVKKNVNNGERVRMINFIKLVFLPFEFDKSKFYISS